MTQPSVETVPFLLTNIWDFTGMSISGFKILDFSYLENLLTGANIGVLSFEPQPRRRMTSFIKGKYPTSTELEKLITNPLHSQMFEHPKVERKQFTVAGWEINFPVWQRGERTA
jgi:hypothetical protein